MTRPPHRSRAVLAALVAAVLLLGAAACSDDGDGGGSDDGAGAGGGDTGEVLRGLATDVIVPSYEAFRDDLTTLGGSLEELCTTPGADTLDASREAWRAAAVSWQETRAAAVGPSMDRRLMADVAFRARPDPVLALLGSDDPIDTESLRGKGSTFRGISLVEELLFGEGADDLASSAGARRCEFLVNVLPISVDAVQVVIDDWTEGPDGDQPGAGQPYVDTFAEGAEGDPLLSVDALANQVIACLTAIDDNGIRDLAMAESLDDALSTRRDSAGAFVMAEHRALLGAVATVVESGLGDLVEARSPETAERLRQLTDDAVAAVADLPDSVDEAYTDHHDGLVAASEAVAALKVLMTTEVASQLGITVRFSDADGDS